MYGQSVHPVHFLHFLPVSFSLSSVCVCVYTRTQPHKRDLACYLKLKFSRIRLRPFSAAPPLALLLNVVVVDVLMLHADRQSEQTWKMEWKRSIFLFTLCFRLSTPVSWMCVLCATYARCSLLCVSSLLHSPIAIRSLAA